MVSLNPCFNGRYAQRASDCENLYLLFTVLILVLMEDTLRGYEKISKSNDGQVLILVLMEDTL